MNVESLTGAVRHIWYLLVSPLFNMLILFIIVAAVYTDLSIHTISGQLAGIAPALFAALSKQPSDVKDGAPPGPVNDTNLHPTDTSSAHPPQAFDPLHLRDIIDNINNATIRNLVAPLLTTLGMAAKVSAITFGIILLTMAFILDYITSFLSDFVATSFILWQKLTPYRFHSRVSNVYNKKRVDFAKQYLNIQLFAARISECEVRQASLAWLSQNPKDGLWRSERASLVEKGEFWKYSNNHLRIYVLLMVLLCVLHFGSLDTFAHHTLSVVLLIVLCVLWILSYYNAVRMERELGEFDIDSFCYYKVVTESAHGTESPSAGEMVIC